MTEEQLKFYEEECHANRTVGSRDVLALITYARSLKSSAGSFSLTDGWLRIKFLLNKLDFLKR